MKARDFMTGSLLTCSPEDSVAQVAKQMRDRDTGDILIMDDGKMVGIVTDRDIAIRVAAKGRNPTEVPIRDYMSKHVVTGQHHWDIDKIAKTMGKHQIRRLPILENGMLVGIVSLGDVAMRHNRQSDIAKSLKMISEPGPIHRLRSRGGGRALMTLGMGLLVATVVALTMPPKKLNSRWEQIREAEIGDKLASASERLVDALQEGGDRLAEMLSA